MEFFALALVAKIFWAEIILWIYEHPACNDVGDSLAGLWEGTHGENTGAKYCTALLHTSPVISVRNHSLPS